MPISYSISNILNYEEVGIGTTDPTSEFPSLYGNYDFGYTVTFFETLGYPIDSVSVASSPIYTIESIVSQNSIRIIKDPTRTIFPNEKYNFAKFDTNFAKSTEIYDPTNVDQADTNTSVYAWVTPSSQTITGPYSFTISYINTSVIPNIIETVIVQFSQTLVWSQIPGTEILIDLVNKSKY